MTMIMGVITIKETATIQAINNNNIAVVMEEVEETIATTMIDHPIALIINPANVADMMVTT